MTLADLHQQIEGLDLRAFMAGAAAVLFLAKEAPGPFARDDLLVLLEREVRAHAKSATAGGLPTNAESPVVL